MRGYFDDDADIDIAFFENGFSGIFETRTIQVDRFDLQHYTLDFTHESDSVWEMGKRWAYANAEIFHDTDGKVRNLIDSKLKSRPRNEGDC